MGDTETFSPRENSGKKSYYVQAWNHVMESQRMKIRDMV